MAIDFSATSPTQITVQPDVKSSTQDKDSTSSSDYWGKGGFHFADLIDIINPLQHIPIVSSVYQEITGDTIAPGPKLAGSALLGGVIGFFASAADLVVEQVSGSSVSGHLMASLGFGQDAATNSPQVFAQAKQHTQSDTQSAVLQTPLTLIDVGRLSKQPSIPTLDFSAMSVPAQAEATISKSAYKTPIMQPDASGVYAINA